MNTKKQTKNYSAKSEVSQFKTRRSYFHIINREIKNNNLEYIDNVEEVDVITLENLCDQNQINEIAPKRVR